jgi:uncharacterized OB-fold protein
MTASTTSPYLPDGLPAPTWDADELQKPYWTGLQEGVIRVQKCGDCGTWQWGPEWICHACRSFNMTWTEVAGRGRIYSWTRVWHPVHPALAGRGPYLAVLVEFPAAGNIRMVGNLLGDAQQTVEIGTAVTAAFEHHHDAPLPFTLLHWQIA